MYEIIEIIKSIWMLLIPVAIVSLILLIAALVSILRKDIPKDRKADKILWIVIVILFDIIGPVIYFAIGSRKLDELSQRDKNGGNYDNR